VAGRWWKSLKGAYPIGVHFRSLLRTASATAHYGADQAARSCANATPRAGAVAFGEKKMDKKMDLADPLWADPN
jgi:hypothetical protein